MIVDKRDCDESGAFCICNQKFRYNDKIKKRIVNYLQLGGAILRLKDSLPVDKIFEVFSLKDYRGWFDLNKKLDVISHDLKISRVWHSEVAFGNCKDDVQIDDLGWIIQYNSETMSETEFYSLIVELAHKYDCEYGVINMPTLSDCDETLVDDIIGVTCYWGMGSHQIAHILYETVLSNFYD